MDDNVSHPKHYTTGKIEVIHFIVDQQLGYRLGNAVKYICRCNHKGNKLLDLKKARQYLDFVIKEEEEREVQQVIEEDLLPESYTQSVRTEGEDDLPDRKREQEHCTCVSRECCQYWQKEI